VWPGVITFDCYGTLVQWPETLHRVFRELVPSDTEEGAFYRDFARCHVRLKSEPYRPYAEILRLALAETMCARKLANVAGAQERLLEAVRAIPPYPDVVPALRSLAANRRIAIVSNTDDALIEATVRGLEIPVEVITAEQARAYKPDLQLFRHAHRRLGVSRDEVVHVGAGYATDMIPAFELGLARIWINRRGERADPAIPPTAELADLSGLASAIATLTPAPGTCAPPEE
jgi:2-haloalkanoic acid dehalogenase type II